MDQVVNMMIPIGLFFVGILFSWLKNDLKRIESKLDTHISERH